MTLTLRYAARSDRGLIRGGNQDSVYAGPRLLAVADGMGGMAAGDVASNIVIACMAPLDEDVADGAVLDALRGAVEQANQQIRDAIDANPAMDGMGTTLTAMLFSGSRLGLVHIGDSRAYLYRDGEVQQVTKDDTYVQMLVDEGRITAEEAGSHPQRSLLTRALDGRDVDPEYSVRQAIPGDRYLLCSDGLSGVVSLETILSTLAEYRDPNQCAERLIQLALRGGGPDNITVIIADVTDADIVESAPIVGGAAARDRGMATSADDSLSAARGAALAGPRHAEGNGRQATEPEPATEEPRRRRHPVRTTILLVVLLGLIGGGLWLGWRYTQSRYYVGATSDGTIAIFQGVPGQVAWLNLSKVHERSELTLGDLTPVARERVNQGIPADNEPAAQRLLDELRRPGSPSLRQTCPSPVPSGALLPTDPSPVVPSVSPPPPVDPNASVPGSPTPGVPAPTSPDPAQAGPLPGGPTSETPPANPPTTPC